MAVLGQDAELTDDELQVRMPAAQLWDGNRQHIDTFAIHQTRECYYGDLASCPSELIWPESISINSIWNDCHARRRNTGSQHCVLFADMRDTNNLRHRVEIRWQSLLVQLHSQTSCRVVPSKNAELVNERASVSYIAACIPLAAPEG